MINNKRIMGIIPARGGSKRLPRKNILPLNEKPLIEWSITAGLASKYIDKLVVSSDDREILSISSALGADIIKRPEELASDIATTFDAIKHTIDNMGKYDYIILLQPTSPLRTSKDIDSAIELLERENVDAVISVSEVEHSPLWSNTLPDDFSMNNFIKKEVENKRSQDLDKYYRLNGAIYICEINSLLAEKTFFIKENIYAYVMSKENSIDIDTLLDFKLAEILLRERKNEKL